MRRPLALLALLAAACGDPSSGASARADERPPRLTVVQRDFAWERTSGPREAPPTLSERWLLRDGPAGWTVAGASEPDPRGLRLRGERPSLSGPPSAPEPGLHHELVVRARTDADARLAIQWTAGGVPFDEDRRHVRALPGGEELHEVRLRLDNLRGIEHGATAAQGAERFRIGFASGDGGPVSAVVHSIELVSAYDEPGLEPRWLGHRGVFRRGLVLQTPGEVSTELERPLGARVRLACAVPGRRRRVRVTVSDPDRHMTPVTQVVESGQPWQSIAAPARDGAGRARRLAVRVESLDGRPAVALVASVLHLDVAPEPRPDALLYVEDTLRADRLGLYGYGHATDPVLRQVGALGATFERCFAVSNWTRPAVSTLLTGLLPAGHGNDDFDDRVGPHVEPLAEALADAGYVTASLVTNFQAGAWSGLERGFDVVFEPGAFAPAVDGSTLTSGALNAPVAALLEEHADEQLFLYVHSLDPHAPYRPPEDDLAALAGSADDRAGPPPDASAEDALRHERDSLAYDAEVRHNDRQLAPLLRALPRDALLMFTSDHGEAFLEHGRWHHRQGLYQEELHVPWVVRLADVVPAGRRVPMAVSQLDLPPTLLGLLGLPVPDGWEGRDLSGLLAGTDDAPAAVPLVADDTLPPDRRRIAVVDWPLKLIARLGPDGTPRPVALHDLERDPAEREDRLRDPALRTDAARLLRAATDYAARVGTDAGARAADLETDPALAEQMRQLGYVGNGR